jgi:hypothetical protein
MDGEQPSWDPCSPPDCRGARLPTTALCLGHAAEQARDAFDAELTRISLEGTVDVRGVVISAEPLQLNNFSLSSRQRNMSGWHLTHLAME